MTQGSLKIDAVLLKIFDDIDYFTISNLYSSGPDENPVI